MFHIVDSTGEWLATYADMVTAHRQARTTHGHRYGYLLRGRDGAEMARHVRHMRRKGIPTMRLPDGVREVVVSPEPPEAEGEEVAA
jgi:hypothetical protein